MIKRFVIINFGCLIASLGYSQQVTKENLMGKWSINDTLGINKNFRVNFIFDKKSNFICEINGEQTVELRFALRNFRDSSFIYFWKAEGDSIGAYRHWIFVKKDTLKIIPYYFVLKRQYNITSVKGIYFKRVKKTTN